MPKADKVRCSKITLLDHIVSGDAQSLRHREAEFLGCFEIDGQQVFHRHLHRKPRWLCASQDIVHIAGRARPVAHEIGTEPMPTMTPGEFGMFIVSETAKWGKVVKFAGVKVE